MELENKRMELENKRMELENKWIDKETEIVRAQSMKLNFDSVYIGARADDSNERQDHWLWDWLRRSCCSWCGTQLHARVVRGFVLFLCCC